MADPEYKLILSSLERIETRLSKVSDDLVSLSLAVVRLEGRVTALEAKPDPTPQEVSEVIPVSRGGIDKKTAGVGAGIATGVMAVIEIIRQITAGG